MSSIQQKTHSEKQGFSPDPSVLPKRSLESYEEIAKRDDNRRKNEEHGQLLWFREKLLPWLQRLTIAYLIYVGFILLFCGLANLYNKIFLDSSVLIALLGTTTATVLALIAVAVASVFPKK